MRRYLIKMRGHGRAPARPSMRHILWSSLGGTAGIGSVLALALYADVPLLVAPFGATCVLAFAVPDSHLAQPRSIIGGYLVSTLVGLLVLDLSGAHAWDMAVAVGLAIGAMQFTRTVHPPAGAVPLLVMMAAPGWLFLVAPVLAGAGLLVVAAVLVNNLSGERRYPLYWV
ncbi:MAG TPA: HPP family protein [Azospirillum sp.]